MEHAPLRPLPSRPSRPADPQLARRYVAARLPALDPQATAALALVELARVERDQAARELGLSSEQMGVVLARARKALRRSRHALSGSGWCERAERLISDRLDGELVHGAAKRLEAHLRNCPRCVEHELRLIGAIDELVKGMPAPVKPAAALRLVLPTVRALPPGRPEAELEAPAEEPEEADEPGETEEPEEPALAPAPPPECEPEPEPEVEPSPAPVLRPVPRAEPPEPAQPAHTAQPPLPAEPPLAAEAPRPADPSLPAEPPRPAEPVPRAAPAPRSLADPRPVAALLAAFTWHIAFALAVLLAVATIAVAAFGIGGGEL